MTERDWQRLGSTMQWMVERQASFEATTEASFARADRRMTRLERFAERAEQAANRRMIKTEGEISDLRLEMRMFLRAMRPSAGDGRAKA